MEGDGRAAEAAVVVGELVVAGPAGPPPYCGTAKTKEDESKREDMAKRIVKMKMTGSSAS